MASAGEPEPEPLGVALEGWPYPYPVKYFPIELQGQRLKMAYMDVKPEQPNGKAIMLLHGKNFNGFYFRKLIHDLSGKGYRVLVPDQIGFGKSSKPTTLQYSFKMMAENTKKLVDTLKITKISVLGHSMGGMLATRFALMYPSLVSKLVLENPIGLEDYGKLVPYKPVEYWYEQELAKTEEGIRNYMKNSYFHGIWKPEYDSLVLMHYRQTLGPEYPRLAWNNALTYDMIMTQPVVNDLPNIKIPTILIIGQLDKTALGKDLVSDAVAKTMGNYPILGKKTSAAIKKSKLVKLAGVGHIPHLEAYDKFLPPVLEFLKK